MAKIEKLRSDIIGWNNLFPLDRSYRQKHHILFNSAKHRELCQIDIYMDWLESELFAEYEIEIIESYKKDEQYKKGIWLQVKEDDEMTDEDFEKIVIN